MSSDWTTWWKWWTSLLLTPLKRHLRNVLRILMEDSTLVQGQCSVLGNNENKIEEDRSHLYRGLCSLCLSTELLHLKMEPFWGLVCIYRISSLSDQRAPRTTRPTSPRAAQLQEPSGNLPRETLSWGKVMWASRQSHLLSWSVCSLIINGNAHV